MEEKFVNYEEIKDNDRKMKECMPSFFDNINYESGRKDLYEPVKLPEDGEINEFLKKVFDINQVRMPDKNGSWEGERGNSIWKPDRDYIPPEKSTSQKKTYSNPDNLNWGEILDKYGIEGIEFKNGYPEFGEVSKGSVEIEGFETGGSPEKNRNFRKAEIVLAEQKGCRPEDVRKWREENNYTWHECEDKKTMQKVPNEVHANIVHDGGRFQKD